MRNVGLCCLLIVVTFTVVISGVDMFDKLTKQQDDKPVDTDDIKTDIADTKIDIGDTKIDIDDNIIESLGRDQFQVPEDIDDDDSQDNTVDDKSVTFEEFQKDGTLRRVWPKEDGELYIEQFNNCTKTILIIDGFMSPPNSRHVTTTASLLRASSNFNTIVVNYDTRKYVQAVVPTGTAIANFLRVLCETYNMKPANVVLYGFSLGAHVAGYASKLFRVGRIMASDPAGPIFDSLPNSIRLDRSDTDMLDVLHTSIIAGTKRERIGHVNFVLDGGSIQSGCSAFNPKCSHLRALEFAHDSLMRCSFQFRQCSGHLAFRNGLCRLNPTITFGFGFNPDLIPRGWDTFFYDAAHATSPFCTACELAIPYINVNVCEQQ